MDARARARFRKVLRVMARAPSLPIPMSRPAVSRLFAARRRAAGVCERKAVTAGFTIPYLEGGEGQTVVLLHGFGDNKDSFVEAVGELTESYRVIMPDLPGFGESLPHGDFDYSLDNMTRVFAGFLREIEAPAAHVVGNSLGGAIAACFALTQPDKVRSLSLLATAGLTMPEPSPLQRRIDAGENPFVLNHVRDYDDWLRFALQRPVPMPAGVRRILAEDFVARADDHDRIFSDLRRHANDLTHRVGAITVPTFILWGTEDRLIDVSVAHLLHQSIARSRLVLLHDIGHCPQYEAPLHTAQLLADFFAEVDRPPLSPHLTVS